MLLKWYSFFISIISVANLNDCFGIPNKRINKRMNLLSYFMGLSNETDRKKK